MKNSSNLPLSQVVDVVECDPPAKLWHIPKVPPGYCPFCSRKVDEYDLSLTKFGGQVWHKNCFRCSLCNQPIGDEKYIAKDDCVFHQNCYKEVFCERCAKCGELIPSNELVNALGRFFHNRCMTCSKCGCTESPGNKFLIIFQFPYCRECFQEIEEYFPKCLTCRRTITPLQSKKDFMFHGRKYFLHHPQCLKCTLCPKEMNISECCVYRDKLFCKQCYETAMSRLCAKCNEPIFDNPISIENICWHTKHFVCSVCQQPIKPDTGVFKNGILKCMNCASEDQSKCAGCGKPVIEHRVSALGAIWHSACLRCQFCRELVYKQKFTSILNKPCCMSCFAALKQEERIDKRGQLKYDPRRKKMNESHRVRIHH